MTDMTSGLQFPCCQHGYPFKWVPPGVSKKTGKQYDGFLGKADDGCAPPKLQTVTQHVPTVAVEAPAKPVQPLPTPGPDWAAKDRLICAQTSGKIAAEFCAGTGDVKLLEEVTCSFFRAFMRVQQGDTMHFPDEKERAPF